MIPPPPPQHLIAATLPEPAATTLTVSLWANDDDGPKFAARHTYVERWWLPHLGPTSLLLLRHLALRVDARGTYTTEVEDLAQMLGVSTRTGPEGVLARSFERLCRFRVARETGDWQYQLRTELPRVPYRSLARMTRSQQFAHDLDFAALCPGFGIDRT